MQQIAQMIRQRWIPALFVLGFLVVVAVNTVLIVTATGSFSGLVVAHPYKKGAEYTQVHQALLAQKALDWHYTIETTQQNSGRIRLVMQWNDRTGLALSDLSISLDASRPVENVAPVEVDLLPRGGGRYEAMLDLAREGLWDLRITALRDGHEFIAAERIRVQ